ncbi:hypothetical protein BJ875DRAFT_463149 [Amylocarpus encephaloides]|uniref:Glycine zipper 2TM domain-containing protein n=1 Tax=Amylocarpus encephaloides TaxID=45428 RepID=A0A9P8C559_9HELO|nr:hypothetical protein BJ875DRAFT_463149 [Amylocarpus encephaloides]
MAAQEYFQGHPQNQTSSSALLHHPPPPYPNSPQPTSNSHFPHSNYNYQTGALSNPSQQLFYPPQQQQTQFHPPVQPPLIQTSYPQALSHLRPSRSNSEPPSSQDYYRRRYRHEHSQLHPRRRSHSRSNESSSRSRSRRRHRHRHKNDRERSRDYSREGSSGYWADRARGKEDRGRKDRNTFLGALGGGVVGDLIAPGLGTLGGALLGGVGGRRTGRSGSDSGRSRTRGRRDRYDEEWEEGRRRRGEI